MVEEKKDKYAFAWLAISDRYVPGAIVSATSIKYWGASADFICLISADVSKQAKRELKKIFTKVFIVDYLEFEVKSLKNGRRMSKSFTKWFILSFTDYTKIAFFDTDTIAFRSMDYLFNSKCPAGSFANAQADTIDIQEITNSLNQGGFVAYNSAIVIEPNIEHFQAFLRMMESLQPFGFNCLSSLDEQAIAYFYSVWDQGPKLSWKKECLCDRIPHIMRYTNEPIAWETPRDEYAYLGPFYEFASIAKTKCNLGIPEENFQQLKVFGCTICDFRDMIGIHPVIYCPFLAESRRAKPE